MSRARHATGTVRGTVAAPRLCVTGGVCDQDKRSANASATCSMSMVDGTPLERLDTASTRFGHGMGTPSERRVWKLAGMTASSGRLAAGRWLVPIRDLVEDCEFVTLTDDGGAASRDACDQRLDEMTQSARGRRLALEIGDFNAQCFSDRAGGFHQRRLAGLNACDRGAAYANQLSQLGLSEATLDSPMNQRWQSHRRRCRHGARHRTSVGRWSSSHCRCRHSECTISVRCMLVQLSKLPASD